MELLQIADPGLGGGVERRRLMRVLAVAQLLTAVERQRDPFGLPRRVLCEVAVDRGVVGRGVTEDLRRQVRAQPRAH